MPRKFVYDYYNVAIPRDAIPEEEERNKELFKTFGNAQNMLFELAFLAARVRTRIYAMPCEWTAQIIDDPDSADFHVRVCRKRHRTKRSHFHMLVGMPGYMPDTNYPYRSRGEAEHCALWEAREFRDCWDDNNDRSWYRVEGNKHDGYEVYRRGGDPPQEVYMTIRVTECSEEDCLKELEDM